MTLSGIKCLISTHLRAFLRSLTRQLLIVYRRIDYAARYSSLNVHVHPTAWIAPKAIIRCSGGGEIRIGEHCEIHDFSMIDSCGGSVSMGNHCSLNPFAIVYGHCGTKIGNDVRIAAHSVIIPANHEFHSMAPLYESGVIGAGIVIGDNVWLGAGARILDGVTIGSRSVVGAGAVVTRPVPPCCLAKGVPARFFNIHVPR